MSDTLYVCISIYSEAYESWEAEQSVGGVCSDTRSPTPNLVHGYPYKMHKIHWVFYSYLSLCCVLVIEKYNDVM